MEILLAVGAMILFAACAYVCWDEGTSYYEVWDSSTSEYELFNEPRAIKWLFIALAVWCGIVAVMFGICAILFTCRYALMAIQWLTGQ